MTVFTRVAGSVRIVSAPATGMNSATAICPEGWMRMSCGSPSMPTAWPARRSAKPEIIAAWKVLRRSWMIWGGSTVSIAPPIIASGDAAPKSAGAFADTCATSQVGRLKATRTPNGWIAPGIWTGSLSHSVCSIGRAGSCKRISILDG